jgi:hypothetical protein
MISCVSCYCVNKSQACGGWLQQLAADGCNSSQQCVRNVNHITKYIFDPRLQTTMVIFLSVSLHAVTYDISKN